MTPTQFLIRFLVSAVLLVASVAAVNVFIDPYVVFDSPRIEKLNARKPAVTTHETMMKGYDSIRRPAKTLILGSSRSDIGLDPLSASWKAEDQPVYNLSLVGSGPKRSALYLQHFIASRSSQEQPDTLVIGLDFESFLSRPSADKLAATGATAPEITSLLVLPDGSDNPHRLVQTIKDYAVSALSLDAVMDSVAAVLASYQGSGQSLDKRGRADEGAFEAAVRSNGFAGLFAHKNMETVRQYGPPRLELSYDEDGSLHDMTLVKDLVDIAQGIDAELVLFIQPLHADRLELFDRLGYWEDFERWKQGLVALIEREQEAGVPVQLWDFAGFEPYVREVVPGPGDRAARLEWFWEPAHYTSALGDILIDRMRSQGSSAEFGTLLSSENLERRLAQIRAHRDEYRAQNPSELERISALLCDSQLCDP